MRASLLIAGATLTLSACGSGGDDRPEGNYDMNAMAADNMMMIDNAMTLNDAGRMDGNAATNSATENMLMNDLTTNTPDTNLANGL